MTGAPGDPGGPRGGALVPVWLSAGGSRPHPPPPPPSLLPTHKHSVIGQSRGADSRQTAPACGGRRQEGAWPARGTKAGVPGAE